VLIDKIIYSFPFRLLVTNIKRNHILLLIWFLLFAVITSSFGKYLGIPYLFLDPEYLNKVNFLSFLIMGVSISGLSVAFHITCYIVEGFKYRFLGSLPKPFAKFSLNNSLIPTLFLITYIVNVVRFQANSEFASHTDILIAVAGILVGYLAMMASLYTYFWFTNKDVFKILADRFDKQLKSNVPVTRVTVMSRLILAKQKPEDVRYYLGLDLKFHTVKDRAFDRHAVIKVFDQNHLNLIFIELFIFLVLLIIGIFRDYHMFQIPAAASVVLFLTIVIMFAGAFSYWFRSWSPAVFILLLLLINLIVKKNVFKMHYQAFGLNYEQKDEPYNLDVIKELNSDSILEADHLKTKEILSNWRLKFGRKRPKMILLAVSGGGQRSALWTFRTLQYADSLSMGRLYNHSMLITGASGGLIGAAYFRELKLRSETDSTLNPYNPAYQWKIAHDNLNPIIFSFLVNDLFVKFQTFQYNGHRYIKDRGYSFEQQLNENTDFMLDKPLISYKDDEYKARIPMMIIAPTIINDGRKLFISPHHVGYMNSGDIRAYKSFDKLVEGVDFRRLFVHNGGDSLRFLSALRMGATFPYITPNITLPSNPPMEIMDAGITDNFGISDGLRFLYAFRDWISMYTSGVVIVSIRDSRKQMSIEPRKNLSLLDKVVTPVQSVYENYAKLQSVDNDGKIEYAKSWFNNNLDLITLQYTPVISPNTPKPENVRRAALNWRLTSREKQSVIRSVYSKSNQEELKRLMELLR